jgi:hypothetical protein
MGRHELDGIFLLVAAITSKENMKFLQRRVLPIHIVHASRTIPADLPAIRPPSRRRPFHVLENLGVSHLNTKFPCGVLEGWDYVSLCASIKNVRKCTYE